jgi:hypothetical protein
MQLGRYAEYLVMMEFTASGYDVYRAEVDDKGIDFVIRQGPDTFYDIQVKSVRQLNYVFMRKSKFEPRPTLLLALVVFNDGQEPDLYLIPSTGWLNPSALLVSRDYPDGQSDPEWGINLSQKNQPLLEPYRWEAQEDSL